MKKKILLIIIAIAVVGTIILVRNNNDKKNNDGIAENKMNTVNTQEESGIWDDWELSIDKTTLKLPMKYSEFINMGFYANGGNVENNIEYCKLEPTVSSGICNNRYGYISYSNGITDGITLIVYNPSNEEINIKDSYIIGIGFITDVDKLKGEIKLINNTRKTEVQIGKSTNSEIEAAFGPHYEYDYSNTFTYYPDENKDGSVSMGDLNMRRFISLYCDSETKILDTSDFSYCDNGGDNYNWDISSNND